MSGVQCFKVARAFTCGHESSPHSIPITPTSLGGHHGVLARLVVISIALTWGIVGPLGTLGSLANAKVGTLSPINYVLWCIVLCYTYQLHRKP